jgi:hypothetical protein
MRKAHNTLGFWRGRGLLWGSAAAVATALTAAVFWFDRMAGTADSAETPTLTKDIPHYVGSGACVSCHADQAERWRRSQHHDAMAEAAGETVLGNFDDSTFTYAGTTSTFFKRDGRFVVRTDGRDGRLAEFTIKYTFGVSPLQQYLVEFPDGRIQALSIAWDSRAKKDGGQRWFICIPRNA